MAVKETELSGIIKELMPDIEFFTCAYSYFKVCPICGGYDHKDKASSMLPSVYFGHKNDCKMARLKKILSGEYIEQDNGWHRCPECNGIDPAHESHIIGRADESYFRKNNRFGHELTCTLKK